MAARRSSRASREEELDEDLWDYVEDGMVKHPLLYMSFGWKSGVARCNSFKSPDRADMPRSSDTLPL
jgi:hypothetical protein